MRTALIVVALSAAAHGACAQESAAQDSSYEKKQTRFNIAGWTLIGAGAAFPLIAVPIQQARSNDRRDCDLGQCADNVIAVTSLVVGPVMIVTGMALLLKRRGLRKEHEREQARVRLLPGLTGLVISGRF